MAEGKQTKRYEKSWWKASSSIICKALEFSDDWEMCVTQVRVHQFERIYYENEIYSIHFHMSYEFLYENFLSSKHTIFTKKKFN